MGCSSDLPEAAPIHLVLDTESIESGCTSEFCQDYIMSCGTTVSIRLTDPDTGAQLESAFGEPLSVCVTAPPPTGEDETICRLGGMSTDLQLFGMPARTLRVEVALWNEDDLVAAGFAPGSCPSPGRFELFDVQGRPKDTPLGLPQPAFAGATYFRAGEQEEVTVALACPNPDLLKVDSCSANLPTRVEAFVTDMGTMQLIRDRQAPTISVAMGEARTVSDNAGGSFSVLDPIDIFSLMLDTEVPTPVYKGSIPRRFGGNGKLACSTTLEGAAQATTTVFCEEVPDKAAELTLAPVLIRKSTVDSVLAALGATEFPESGLVIGRVVNEGFSPSAGVAVTPSEGNVLYLSDDLSDVTPTLTSASAYFVATDVPDGATWTASHFDGRKHAGSPRGGLIQGKVSAVVIRMTGDVVGP